MSHTDIFNWPPFAVPATAPQVSLYFDRTGGLIDTSGWQCTDRQGRRYVSAAVYFGALALHGGTVSERERHMRQGLGLPQSGTIRLDYACTADEVLLLRAGIPGHLPQPYTVLAAGAVAEAESLIADFLARDFRTILLCRCSQQADGDILFEGEAEFYEGFLGEDGLPLPVGDSDSADDALQPLGCGLGLVRS
ncbi:hypothetical protein [Adlercreutzia caecimuris]|uniref:hypothetical protein n=1 Tax=Adlercreutzia caecimuris TaxID=671266 RepID=UPI00272957EE|nr:hypothetical protein [Adlercreutzia caecimuris]